MFQDHAKLTTLMEAVEMIPCDSPVLPQYLSQEFSALTIGDATKVTVLIPRPAVFTANMDVYVLSSV